MFLPPTTLNALHSITIFNMLRAPKIILFWTKNTVPPYKLRFYDTLKDSIHYTDEMFFSKTLKSLNLFYMQIIMNTNYEGSHAVL